MRGASICGSGAGHPIGESGGGAEGDGSCEYAVGEFTAGVCVRKPATAAAWRPIADGLCRSCLEAIRLLDDAGCALGIEGAQPRDLQLTVGVHHDRAASARPLSRAGGTGPRTSEVWSLELKQRRVGTTCAVALSAEPSPEDPPPERSSRLLWEPARPERRRGVRDGVLVLRAGKAGDFGLRRVRVSRGPLYRQ